MKISIISIGSHGDIAPLIPLCQGLIARGHDPCLIANNEVEQLAKKNGVPFRSLGFSTKAILLHEKGKPLSEAKSSSESLRILATIIKKNLENVTPHIVECVKDADVILINERYFLIGHLIATLQKALLIQVCFQPKGETNQYPYLFFNTWVFKFLSNRKTHQWVDKMLLKRFLPSINALRVSKYNLPKLKLSEIQKIKSETPLLQGFSQHVFSPPRDWPKNYRIAGYWFANSSPGKLTRSIQNFFQSNRTKVHIGFGSMIYNPEKLIPILECVAKKLNIHFLLALNWSLPRMSNKLKNRRGVTIVETISHEQIFPMVDITIHHGGAGTTATAIRCATPQLIFWFMLDQEFWATQVAKLGIGINGGCFFRITEEIFLRNLSQLLNQKNYKNYKKKNQKLCQYVNEEDGVKKAGALIEEFSRKKNSRYG